MIKNLPLQILYQSQTDDLELDSPFLEIAHAYLLNQEMNDEILEHKEIWHYPLTEENVIKNGRNLLSLALCGRISGNEPHCFPKLSRSFLNMPLNQHARYEAVIVALIQFFAGMPVRDMQIDLLE